VRRHTAFCPLPSEGFMWVASLIATTVGAVSVNPPPKIAVVPEQRIAESGSRYPRGAVVPLLIGALLMMLEGVYLIAYGSSITFSALIPAGATIPSLYVSGYLAFVEGALLLVLSMMAVAWRGAHRFVGVGSLTIGLLSLFSGGGFWIGAAFAYVGGVIAIYHTPTSAASPDVGPSPESPDYDPVIEADMNAPQ
jgi:hypothetical protein